MATMAAATTEAHEARSTYYLALQREVRKPLFYTKGTWNEKVALNY